MPAESKNMFSNSWTKWLFIFLLWTLFGLFFIVQSYVFSASTDRTYDWVQNFVYRMLNYWLWALLTPVIYFISQKFKLEEGQRMKNFFILLLIGVFISVFHSFTSIYLSFVINHALGKLQNPVLAQLSIAKYGIIGGSFDSLFMYFVILGIIYSFGYYKKNQEQQYHLSQLEARLAQAELQSLKMQLHPHFLFNTLHAISSLMHRDPDAADKMITRLSNLLRISLDNIGVQEVTLKDELEFLTEYIEIQKIRFHDSLTVRMNIEPNTLTFMVPNLILQPLVENAFKHSTEVSGIREIAISTRLNNGNLELMVENNGIGNNTHEISEGVGMRNTRLRLEQLYGNGFSFDFKTLDEGIFSVVIRLPIYH